MWGSAWCSGRRKDRKAARLAQMPTDDSDSHDDDTAAEGGTETAETATATPRASARLAARNERQP